MKEVKAIIRPTKLSILRQALMSVPGFPGMTVSQAEGCSAPSRHGAPTNIREELTDYTPKVRVEIVCPDELVDALVDRISNIAHTGQLGDGIVWVTEVQRTFMINKSQK